MKNRDPSLIFKKLISLSHFLVTIILSEIKQRQSTGDSVSIDLMHWPLKRSDRVSKVRIFTIVEELFFLEKSVRAK